MSDEPESELSMSEQARAEGAGPAQVRAEDASPTLYEWAGGSDAFRAMINAFYDRVESDDLLQPVVPRGREPGASVETSRPGGSRSSADRRDYTAELGGYERMLAHHRGLQITAEQRFRFATLMSRAADDATLPDDPEFRAALVGYLEWGTRLAVANSQTDAEVVEQAPVPRWGWGVAPPYLPG